MALHDAGQRGQVLLEETGEIGRVVEGQGELREATHVDREHGRVVCVRHEQPGVRPGAQHALDRAGAQPIGGRGSGSRREADEGRRGGPEPARREARDRPDAAVREVEPPRHARPRQQRRDATHPALRPVGLARAARHEQLRVRRLEADGVDRAPGGGPGEPVEGHISEFAQ